MEVSPCLVERHQSFMGTLCLHLQGKEPRRCRQQVPPNHWYSKLDVSWHVWGLGVQFTSIHGLQIRKTHMETNRVKTACLHFNSGMGLFLGYTVDWWMTDLWHTTLSKKYPTLFLPGKTSDGRLANLITVVGETFMSMCDLLRPCPVRLSLLGS
jgi:hypothetical protein